MRNQLVNFFNSQIINSWKWWILEKFSNYLNKILFTKAEVYESLILKTMNNNCFTFEMSHAHIAFLLRPWRHELRLELNLRLIRTLVTQLCRKLFTFCAIFLARMCSSLSSDMEKNHVQANSIAACIKFML